MFILGNCVECLGREVQGGTEHMQQGSCCSQAVGVREGFLKEVALALTWRMHSTWGGDKFWVGGQHLQRFSFLDKLARCEEVKQRMWPGPAFQWWGPEERAGCLERYVCMVKYCFPIEFSSLWEICRIQREIFQGDWLMKRLFIYWGRSVTFEGTPTLNNKCKHIAFFPFSVDFVLELF